MSNRDEIQLSDSTRAALEEFLQEQAEKSRKHEEIKRNVLSDNETVDLDEDWQLSQFWYAESFATALAHEVIRASGGGHVACISCPTLYKALRKLKDDLQSVRLLEFDTRFAVYGEDFVLYDYRSPLDLPRDWRELFDVVVADPPFLSDECLTKTCSTIKFLAKNKIIVCTGAVMKEIVWDLLGLEERSIKPKHNNNLSNEFRCYANYSIDSYMRTEEK